LDGVTDGKPASVAGFKTGDIVIKIGNFEINDIQEYMKALSNFSKGQTTDVEVMRGKEVIKKSVTF
jgi:S1-C subfamily serine protease